MTRLAQGAAILLLAWFICALSGTVSWANGEGGVSLGEEVAAISFCYSREAMLDISKAIKTSDTKKEAGRKIEGIFKSPGASCFILPRPVKIRAEDVLDSGVDFDGDTYYILETTSPQGRKAWFIFFDLPGMRKPSSFRGGREATPT